MNTLNNPWKLNTLPKSTNNIKPILHEQGDKHNAYIGPYPDNPSQPLFPLSKGLLYPDHYLKYRWECFLSDNRDHDWGLNTIGEVLL